MATNYPRIVGSKKISADYETINETFEMVGQDVDRLDNRDAQLQASITQTGQAIDSVQEQINTLVINGDSSAAAAQAAIDANGHNYGNLKVRLDAEHEQVTSQLADTAKKTEINELANDVDTELEKKRDKSVLIVSGDLDISSDANKIKPIHLASDTLAMMAGTTPIAPVPAKDSITYEYLAPRSVSRARSKFYKPGSSNLFDVDDEVDSNGYYGLDGSYSSAISGYGSTGFISVVPGVSYYTNLDGFITFWDVSKNFISGINNAGTITFIPPNGAVYVNCALRLSEANTKFLVKGTEGTYEPARYKDPKLLIEFNQTIGYIPRPKLDIIELTSVSVNLLDKTMINTNGYYRNTDGTFIPSTQYYSSDFIKVSPGATYKHRQAGHTTFWDENMQFVSGVNDNSTFTVPVDNGIVYVIITIYATDVENDMLVKGTILPNVYVPYKSGYRITEDIVVPTTTELNGYKWAALGDSITAGFGATTQYQSIIAVKNNMIAYNYGISGTRIAVVSGQSNPMCERYVNMTDDAEVITVFGGTNDYTSNVPIGDLDSSDTSTFMGALNTLCRGLIQKYPGKRIGFITPMMRRNVDYSKMQSYVDAIKNICARYSIPVLDMFAGCGLYPSDDVINNTFFASADGLHPNNEGQEIIARRIESFIMSL